MVRFALVGVAVAVLIPAAALGQDKQHVRGKVVKLGDAWVTIKSDDGRTLTLYAPRGNERIIQQLGQLRVGDRVAAGWYQGDEYAFLTGIEKLSGEDGGGGGEKERPKDKPQPQPQGKDKEREKEKEKEKEKQDGKEGNEGRELPLRVVEGRVLRITESEGILTLTLLVEGRRIEFLVPRRLEGEVRELRTGYLVGVGYGTEREVNFLRWVFLIRGGKVDRREEWAKERAANKEEWEKSEREENAKKEKEEQHRREMEEKERRKREEEEKRKEKEGDKEKKDRK
jgi:hypothetical protein